MRAGAATVLGSRALRSLRSGRLGEGTRTSALEGRGEGGSSPGDDGASAASDVRATASTKPTPH